MFHFHKWLPWSRPIGTYSGGKKQQWRVCSTCNKAQFRTLRWDEQSGIKDINAAIDEMKALASEVDSHTVTPDTLGS